MFDGAITVQLVQGLIGNLIVFFVMAFIVELSLYGFGVQNSRLRAFCRCLPIIKLPLGVFLYGVIDVNLFSCDSMLKPLFCSLFFTKETFLEYSKSGLSLPKYFAEQIPQKALFGFFAAFLVISAGIALKRAYQCIYLLLYLKKACQRAAEVTRKIANPALQNVLRIQNIRVLMSNDFQVPVAVGKKCILMPKSLIDELSQDEFEAVIAHELEHLRWKDPIVKFACTSICFLFWWIPTGWWLKRIEEEQEYASDRGICRFGYEGVTLASALAKVLKRGKSEKAPLLCQFTVPKHRIFLRIEKMLAVKSLDFSNKAYIGLAALVMAFILIGYRIC